MKIVATMGYYVVYESLAIETLASEQARVVAVYNIKGNSKAMIRKGFLQQLGNYKLVCVIGRGGFATVYLGQHVHLEANYAAVKVLNFNTEADLFKQEAQKITRLVHPNIIRVLDFSIQDETTFMIMEYAPYGSLQTQYRPGTLVPLDAVLSYVNQAAIALQHAHNHNIIHCDVKPSNLLLDKRQTILLSDFGVALATEGSHSPQMIETTGTIAYSAPEQIRGEPQYASDQYALAITTYEWLCGTRPFQGSLDELTTQHLSSLPPPLRSHNPNISPEVEDIVLQALEKDPIQRFPTIQEFANVLEHAAGISPRLASRESFTRVEMGHETRDTIVFPVGRSSANIPPDKRKRLTSMGTMREREEEPETGPSRQSVQRSLISRRATLLALGVGGIASLAYATLQSSLATHDVHVQPTSIIAPIQTQTGAPGTKRATFVSHGAPVFSVAWSPDGKSLASGGADTSVQLWYPNGGAYKSYYANTKAVTCVVWSPDGKHIASASNDRTITIQDRDTSAGFSLIEYPHPNEVSSVAWSPDGTRVVSGCKDAAVRVWDVSSPYVTAIFHHMNPVQSVVWSPDGKFIASASGDEKATVKDNTVRVWNVGTNVVSLTYSAHTSTVYATAWSPDGKSIASASADTTVHIWDATTGKTMRIYRGHRKTVQSVAWSPDGKRIASGSVDTTVRVWNAASGTIQDCYQGHSSTVFGVSWSPDGKQIASASGDKTAQIWEV